MSSRDFSVIIIWGSLCLLLKGQNHDTNFIRSEFKWLNYGDNFLYHQNFHTVVRKVTDIWYSSKQYSSTIRESRPSCNQRVIQNSITTISLIEIATLSGQEWYVHQKCLNGCWQCSGRTQWLYIRIKERLLYHLHDWQG